MIMQPNYVLWYYNQNAMCRIADVCRAIHEGYAPPSQIKIGPPLEFRASVDLDSDTDECAVLPWAEIKAKREKDREARTIGWALRYVGKYAKESNHKFWLCGGDHEPPGKSIDACQETTRFRDHRRMFISKGSAACWKAQVANNPKSWRVVRILRKAKR